MSVSLEDRIRQLTQGDANARLAAAEGLMQAGEGASPASAALVQAVGDEDEQVREAAVAALEGSGRPPVDSLGRLAELLDDARPDVAYWAATLLGRLEDDAAGAAGKLGRVLGDDGRELSVRERAAWALGKIGPAADVAADSLRQARDSGPPRLARLAASALERIESR